ncbi:hypothetical protein JCM14635_22550 [Megalodesulfovibrio paquesii]
MQPVFSLPCVVPDDLQAVQDELVRLLTLDPAAIESSLALAAMHRAQGDPQRALTMRLRLAHRPGLDKGQRGRLQYEMGRDLLRMQEVAKAQEAFEAAQRILPRNEAVRLALADCALRQSRFKDAAKLFADVNRKEFQAHALARYAQQLLLAGECSHARRHASRAAALAPACPEGWLVLVREAACSRNWNRLDRQLRKGLAVVPPRLWFVLLEALLNPEASWHDAMPAQLPRPCCLGSASVSDRVHPADNPLRILATVVQEAIAACAPVRTPDAAACHLVACLCRAGNVLDASRRWLEQALTLEPAFWRARMDLARLDLPRQEAEQPFSESLQALFGLLQARPRFACSACGHMADTLFFHCPRCQSWRRIAYRM